MHFRLSGPKAETSRGISNLSRAANGIRFQGWLQGQVQGWGWNDGNPCQGSKSDLPPFWAGRQVGGGSGKSYVLLGYFEPATNHCAAQYRSHFKASLLFFFKGPNASIDKKALEFHYE
jgi:hypothetical protein